VLIYEDGNSSLRRYRHAVLGNCVLPCFTAIPLHSGTRRARVIYEGPHASGGSTEMKKCGERRFGRQGLPPPVGTLATMQRHDHGTGSVCRDSLERMFAGRDEGRRRMEVWKYGWKCVGMFTPLSGLLRGTREVARQMRRPWSRNCFSRSEILHCLHDITSLAIIHPTCAWNMFRIQGSRLIVCTTGGRHIRWPMGDRG